MLAFTGVGVATAASAPRLSADAQAEAAATQALRGLTLEQKVGQLFVTWVNGKSADEVHPKNQTDFGVDTPAQVIEKYHLGGVIYFNNDSRDNFDDPVQVAKLSNGLQQAAVRSGAHIPLQIAADQEGGTVTRMGAPATEFPNAMAVSAGRDTNRATQAATILGRELRAVGINQDFAPDSDVNSNPVNPVIGVRSFSGQPGLASDFVTAEIKGFQDSGFPTKTVAATAKHFPGHGAAPTDSHTGLPRIDSTEAQWRATDVPPFKAAIAAGVDSIMSAHIQFPSLDPSLEPATLSQPIITGRLRNELGYRGVVITDSLEMEGVRRLHSDAEIPVLALKAGVDQLLMPVHLELAINSVIAAVKSGDIPMRRIDQSVLRVLKLKFLRGILFSPFVDTGRVMKTVGIPSSLETAQDIADRGITAIANDAGLLPLKQKPATTLVTGWGVSTTATLAQKLTAHGTAATAYQTGQVPTDAQIAQAVAKAQSADLVVVLTNNIATYPLQTNLLNALQATGKPVVAVAAQIPYDAGYPSTVRTWLATYGYITPTLEALAKVIVGETKPIGKLPVDIPAGADMQTVKYPFGHGLTW
ncbi:beta-N-acetylhexosaminidase [Amycolatopsis mediterranei S699]|uniref:beta-N-acetylhexosaminidase n=2 Tax=Amycolatopsis mediterranei TaxID=33910 RepID=A0A0H3DIJ9_AMYMU|nr:glycoside hydrolase family 3 protein [Amycolatopsis mediterranei]ADJ50501.1 beta-N-acetylhexosaminidase [Amycolatopsis mediterranei U32]AEK47506.1 beta-N-acetylhexosaminidase [Amycolatopsis mediterranei S699]AFO82207.1 beta-N-acetylhexosaminidase [Amycolatopsis mediterranei S699]AGT89336.1 beta-N-acetylhexosaminidase [Amycolatopsis mediterranei RB]KDO09541.1 beta-N-acetylhexosaminidase [Amycolatopsis mediterranei]